MEQAIREIMESKRRIEEHLGREVNTLAYPYGRQTPALRHCLDDNFLCACGTQLGLVSRRSDAFALERIDMCYLRPRPLFSLLFSPMLPCYLYARRLPRELRQLAGWGGTA